jgi:hypothetical protein
MRGGLWAGLPIPSNPWVGSDRTIVASIRERLGEVPPEPDGPPLLGAQAAASRLKMADGIREAYVAIYQHRESGGLTVVYGLDFEQAGDAPALWQAIAPRHPETIGTTAAHVVAVVSGQRDECAEAVAAHLRTIS